MNKKQVGALLKVMGKDEFRDLFRHLVVQKVQGRMAVVATNGVAIAIIWMDDIEALEGHMIKREYVERWYKLATGKDRFDTDAVIEINGWMYADDNIGTGDYPEVERIVPDDFRAPVGAITFNAEYMFNLQTVDGSESLTWSLGGTLDPVMAKSERGIYIFMPKKAQT